MMGWYDGWGGGSPAWWGMGLMVLFWAVVIGVAVWAIMRLTSDRGRSPQTTPSPRATLDRRFAAGEIDTEQYVEARRLLEGSGRREAAPGA